MSEAKKAGKSGRTGKKDQKENRIMMSDLLSAISESEYPNYILEAIEQVQEWMKEMINPDNELKDDAELFKEFFGMDTDDEDYEYEDNIEALISRLESIKAHADVIPNQDMPDGKPDAIIVSITPPEYESGLRTAIDYAAVFNRDTCKRVWIISDTFIFDEAAKYIHHVDALNEQGITLRYILVTAWGWVELPLSANMATKQSFMFQTEGNRRRRRK